MKRKLVVLLLCIFLCCTISACSTNKPVKNDLDTEGTKDYSPEYLNHLEEQISYYEKMAERYNLAKFDTVYYPEINRYYCSEITHVFHADWFCEYFDKSKPFFMSANGNDYSKCSECCSADYYLYLDTETKIYHKFKSCLTLKPNDDYTAGVKTYRFGRVLSATINGYKRCETCYQQQERLSPLNLPYGSK